MVITRLVVVMGHSARHKRRHQPRRRGGKLSRLITTPSAHLQRPALAIPPEDVILVENAGNEGVEDHRDEQRNDVEEDHVGEKVALVVLPVEGKLAGDHLRLDADVVERLDLGEEEPRRAVGGGEHPHVEDDPLGPANGAELVRQHRVADGDVALHGEGRYGEAARVDAQKLEEDEEGAAHPAPDPLVAEDVVGDDAVGNRGQEDHAVGDGQRHEVAVSGRSHASTSKHHDHHHDIAEDA